MFPGEKADCWLVERTATISAAVIGCVCLEAYDAPASWAPAGFVTLPSAFLHAISTATTYSPNTSFLPAKHTYAAHGRLLSLPELHLSSSASSSLSPLRPHCWDSIAKYRKVSVWRSTSINQQCCARNELRLRIARHRYSHI